MVDINTRQSSFQAEATNRWFKQDFATSRKLFMQSSQQLTRLPTATQSWRLSFADDLVTDTLWVGNRDAHQVLVLISATHGVEGYCGSAAQSFILNGLQEGQFDLPEGLSCLFIHALNPWGMNWARRCDQAGIDLNRNFVDFSKPRNDHPKYPQISKILEMATPEARNTALVELAKTWGQSEFDRAFSGGQFQSAWAPFYGGDQPAFANKVIEQLIEYWQLSARTLCVLDIHSGLGPYGFGELISDHKPNSKASQFARQLFGNAVAETATGQSFSVEKAGLLDYRWHQLMTEGGCFLTLEFGTLGTDSLFNTILNDHYLWRKLNHLSQSADWQSAIKSVAGYRLQRQSMLAHFCPQNTLWQQAVLFKTWQVVSCALTQSWTLA